MRGIYPDQIDDDVAYRLGRAFARVLRDLRGGAEDRLRVAVGHDMRLHSPALAGAFSRGLVDEGCRRARHRDGRHRDGLLRRRVA